MRYEEFLLAEFGVFALTGYVRVGLHDVSWLLWLWSWSDLPLFLTLTHLLGYRGCTCSCAWVMICSGQPAGIRLAKLWHSHLSWDSYWESESLALCSAFLSLASWVRVHFHLPFCEVSSWNATSMDFLCIFASSCLLNDLSFSHSWSGPPLYASLETHSRQLAYGNTCF